MNNKPLAVLSLICLTVTALWLVFLIVDMATAGPLESFAQVLAHVSRLNAFFYMTYINATLVTLIVMVLFTALARHYESMAPEWCAIASTFVPVYGAMNLLVYLSQITVVPRLLELYAAPEHQAIASLLLREAIQQWPDSAVSIVNNLAYAVLGIPSVILGTLMLRSSLLQQSAGVLIAVSGLGSMAGFVGIVLRSPWLRQGSLVAGVLFLLALVPMSWGFWPNPESRKEPSVP